MTSQAVSRWEANGVYPDMEMMPAIANYFHISIDELLRYSAEREEKIKNILDKAEKVLKKQGRILYGAMSEDIGECIDWIKPAVFH